MFGGAETERHFVRETVPATERAISFVILVLLAALGAYIYATRENFDPALFSFDASTQEAAPARREVVLYEEGYEGALDAETARAEDAGGGLFAGLAPDGWSPLGSVEQFTAETLYEKINGRAEQYMAYSVVGLTCAGFAGGDDGDTFLDVFVYDMGTAMDAFGIYSVERTPDAPAIALGRGGYRSGASYFYWKGQYYVQVMASSTGDALAETVLGVAQAVAARLEDSEGDVWGLALLPEEDRVEGSVEFYKQDALSLDFLPPTFTSRYRVDGVEVTAFVSRHESRGAAAKTFASYQDYLRDFGEIAEGNEAGARRLVGGFAGMFDVVFSEGVYVAGVNMAPDRSAAESLAGRLETRLTQTTE